MVENHCIGAIELESRERDFDRYVRHTARMKTCEITQITILDDVITSNLYGLHNTTHRSDLEEVLLKRKG